MTTKPAIIIGVCLILAALIIALVPRPQPLAPTGPQIGRYQMGSGPGHAYVIDTATGKVWEKFSTPNQGTSDPEFSKPKVK